MRGGAWRGGPQAPSGLLPAMELNGRFLTESDAIMALLEQSFPDYKPLLPPRGSESAQACPGHCAHRRHT